MYNRRAERRTRATVDFPALSSRIDALLAAVDTLPLAFDERAERNAASKEAARAGGFWSRLGDGDKAWESLGMLMQPAQREAYSLNSALGAAAGIVTGYVLAPQINTTPRRMIRIAGLSLAGGALPFLLYAGIHDKHATWDERLTGGFELDSATFATISYYYWRPGAFAVPVRPLARLGQLAHRRQS